MSSCEPITETSDIVRVLPCLPEKFIVDFANGIDVARDHLRVQKQRSDFGARLFDEFTGKAARRDAAINASLADGVESSLRWLTELTSSLAKSNYAIERVNYQINQLNQHVTVLAGYSAETRRQLEELSVQMESRYKAMENEIGRIDFIQKAERNLDHVLSKWASGRYHGFSLSGRCYAAIYELYWGEFGDYCRSQPGAERQRFIETLANKSIDLLARDANTSPLARLDTQAWLENPQGSHVLPDASDALAYLGDWSTEDSPFVYSATQMPRVMPMHLPRISSSERVIEGLVSEVFERAAHV